MSRWTPDARERLERAALDLFAEQGFAETTVPQITARAGLTTRTFFRHFADKREVLFGAEDELPTLVTTMLAATPLSLTAMEVIEQGLDAFAVAAFNGRRDALLTRRAIIQSDESLRERELRKRFLLADAIREGFISRGADDLSATLTAEIAMTVVGVSLDRWLDGAEEQSLSDILRHTLTAIRTISASAPDPVETPHPVTTGTAGVQ